MFKQDSAPAHHAVHVQQYRTAASRNAKLSCVQPVASKQPRSQSCGLRDLGIYSIDLDLQHRFYHRQIYSVNELKRRLTNVWCSLEQSIFEETIDRWRGRHRACVQDKEDILSTTFELTMLILSIYVTFNVTCLIVTSLITKSCPQRWPIHSCSFYKVVD